MPKSAYLIAVVIIAIAAAGTGTVFYVLPALQPRAAEFSIEMLEFGYDEPSSGPTLTVKAGQLVRVRLTNIGAVEHEFMLVADKDESLTMMKDMIKEIQAMDLTVEEMKERYHEMHEQMTDQMAIFGVWLELEPDESDTLEFTIEEPGTYWYVCHNVGGSWPETHQEKGMFGKLVIEPS